MTPTSEPAQFVLDATSGRYIPANRVANTLAAQSSRRFPTLIDIAVFKARGYRCILTNGEEIRTGLTV